MCSFPFPSFQCWRAFRKKLKSKALPGPLVHTDGKEMTRDRFSPGDLFVQEGLLERASRDAVLVGDKDAGSIVDAGGCIRTGSAFVQPPSGDRLEMLWIEVFGYDGVCSADFVALMIEEWSSASALKRAAGSLTPAEVARKLHRGNLAIHHRLFYEEHSKNIWFFSCVAVTDSISIFSEKAKRVPEQEYALGANSCGISQQQEKKELH